MQPSVMFGAFQHLTVSVVWPNWSVMLVRPIAIARGSGNRIQNSEQEHCKVLLALSNGLHDLAMITIADAC